jgi:hypothetical protein
VILESEMSSQDLMQNGLTPDDTASEAIHFDRVPQQRTLDITLSILNNMTCVESDLKTLMLRHFNQAVPFQKIPEKIAEKLPSGHRSLVSRVKNLILSCFKK